MTIGPDDSERTEHAHSRRHVWQLALFVTTIFAVWTIRATRFDSIDESIHSPIARAAYSTALKGLLWLMPAAVFARQLRHTSPPTYLALTSNTTARVWGNCLTATALFLGIIATIELTIGHKALSFTPLSELPLALCLLQLFLSPLIEELLFRGLILKELLAFTRPTIAVVADSLLFLAIHLPYWLTHRPIDGQLIMTSLGVFAFSLLAGYLYVKSTSIWPPTIAHIANNSLAMILVNPTC